MGLLQDDLEWHQCMRDAALVMTNIHKLSELFVIILYFNAPSDPRRLWDEFKNDLSDDFKYRRIQLPFTQQFKGEDPELSIYIQDDYDRALHAISDILLQSQYNKELPS